MRPSRRIERIARHDAESEPRIEARGLRILLIDIDTPHAAAGDGMFHETPPQPPAPQVGRDESISSIPSATPAKAAKPPPGRRTTQSRTADNAPPRTSER